MVLATSGPRRVQHDASVAANRNVGHAERWLSVLGGSALAVIGANRRGAGGLAIALMGAELIRRGATGRCLLYDALGVSTASDATSEGFHHVGPAGRSAVLEARHAVKIERSITVDRSPEELYAFWREPRNLPRFMHLIEAVEPLGDTRARWRTTSLAGKSLVWEVEVFNDVPNQLIAWRSVPGAPVANAGSVHFRAHPDSRRGTEVRVVADYEPPGGVAGQWLSKLLGRDPDAMLREDLRRFKQLIETGEVPPA